MRRLAAVAGVLSLAGCGEERPYLAPGPPIDQNCQDAGRAGSRTFRACYRPQLSGQPVAAAERHGSLEVSLANGPWRRLSVPHPLGAKPGQPAAGHWDWAAVSPDGSSLLAQWTAECEVPLAFLVPARGGDAVAVARGRYGPATSKALGWTRDGRAIVELPGLSCGSTSRRPGAYVLRPSAKPKLVYWRPLGELRRSTTAREGPG